MKVVGGLQSEQMRANARPGVVDIHSPSLITRACLSSGETSVNPSDHRRADDPRRPSGDHH